MLDKVEARIPYGASFQPEFRFLPQELKYAGLSSTVKKSQHYAGTCDLRPFKIPAIVHINYKRGSIKNHKLELLQSGRMSLRQMGEAIVKVFDVDPEEMRLMRTDFAADLDGIAVPFLYDSLRVKYKRSLNANGELDYETVGGRRLEYFRYGKSPNCVRIYDKPAECMARFKVLIKQANPDADPPTFEDLFGFPPETIRARVERQAGGGRIPQELSTFGQLRNAADFDPFKSIEIVPNTFPYPDPKQFGAARAAKIIGIHALIQKHGYQQARAMMNCDRNGKRHMDEYMGYVHSMRDAVDLQVGDIVASYRGSVARQIDGSIENDPERK